MNNSDKNTETTLAAYKFPSTALPSPAKNKIIGDPDDKMHANAHKLITTLKSFGLDATLIQINHGPRFTCYDLKLGAGVRLSEIMSLADDIALSLMVPSVKIEPILSEGIVSVEMPNSEVSVAAIRDILDSAEFKNTTSKLSIALGIDNAGKSLIVDITKTPHTLIAGTSGSGKSTCINSMIVSILHKSAPSDVKFIMISPDNVDLLLYNGIPHLLTPVITDPRKAVGALNWAVTEMIRRNTLFANSSSRSLEEYNKYAELQCAEKLPPIVIIIDDFAALTVSPKETEDAIYRLTKLPNTCGIHLIISTSLPTVDIISGRIKANIPSRIAFAMHNHIDSRTILDSTGAEMLLGCGDMLYRSIDASKPLRLQGSFISNVEVERVVNFIKDVTSIRCDEEIGITMNDTSKTANISDNTDDLLPRAIELALAAGRISTAALQRHLGIGYARALRMIAQMEARGIIDGAGKRGNPHYVLISAEDLCF